MKSPVIRIFGIEAPSTSADAVTKAYIDTMTLSSYYQYAPVHDPRFAEIEQIMHEVGVDFVQVMAYATEYMPMGVEPVTAKCVKTNKKHVFFININSAKQFLIQIDRISEIGVYSNTARWFDMYRSDFFLDLARYLRKEKALSLPKYWLVRLKLWWNK